LNEPVLDMTTRIAAGDTEAFARLYEAWFDWMYAEARRATRRDESFCLDVVQDAMLRVIRSMRPLQNEAALRAWLRRTVHSAACDILRRETRRRRRELERPAITSDGARRERLAWLERALRDVDEHSRNLLMLRHRMGLTLAQIGAAVGLGTGAVDRRLRRTLAALGEQATKEELDD
jgi:RNA polymerase sigma factor (sigma-70 family)